MTASDDRAQRLAAQLRADLKRRKAQARAADDLGDQPANQRCTETQASPNE